MKPGGKNIPRLGRRSGGLGTDEKFYSHVQPFDSKFILDFLSDELSIDNGDLKFLSWDDLDRALESDASLKEKLSNIARDKEIEELKRIANKMSRDIDHEVIAYGDMTSNNIYQKFVPYGTDRSGKFNNNENDIYYYYNNEVKRSNMDNVEQLKKLFA